MELLGIDPKKSVADNLKGISDKLIIFINDLDGILKSVVTIVEGLTKVRKYFFQTQAEKEAGATAEQKAYAADLATVGEHDAERGKFFRQWENSPGKGMLDAVAALWGGTWKAMGGMGGLVFGNNTPMPLPPKPPGWKPEGWGTTPADVGATRRSDLAPQQVNHNVRLEVTGNAEVIGALMDEKSKAQFPIFFSQELIKALVQAPK